MLRIIYVAANSIQIYGIAAASALAHGYPSWRRAAEPVGLLALRAVKKDVALLHHFGSQSSASAVLGLPRAISSLVRSDDQDVRIRKAIKGMVIHRDDGIVILDKTLGELASRSLNLLKCCSIDGLNAPSFAPPLGRHLQHMKCTFRACPVYYDVANSLQCVGKLTERLVYANRRHN